MQQQNKIHKQDNTTDNISNEKAEQKKFVMTNKHRKK